MSEWPEWGGVQTPTYTGGKVYLADWNEDSVRGFFVETQAKEIEKYLAKGWHLVSEEEANEVRDAYRED